MAKLTTGDRAPAFGLKDQDGELVRLSHFRGQRVLLYFYPKADTSGCTAQACSVRDSAAELKAAGVVPLGVSPDPPDKQARFDGKYSLGFRLLSDPEHKAAEAYGVWAEKSMYGRKYFGIVRSSFLIDARGKVIEAWYKVKPADTVPKALAAIEGD